MGITLYDYCISNGLVELLEQWDGDKNDGLSPELLKPFSNKSAWWRCEKGHEYQMLISHRARGSGCPYCARKKLLPGFNDLATLEPQVAAQWHPTLNEGLAPYAIAVGSHEKVWWQCEQGHVWNAMVYSRTGSLKRGCPFCSAKPSKKRCARQLEMLAEAVSKAGLSGGDAPAEKQESGPAKLLLAE